jgi:hypothetical protein
MPPPLPFCPFLCSTKGGHSSIPTNSPSSAARKRGQAHALTLRCSVTSRDALQPQDPEPRGIVAAANPSLKPSNQKIEQLFAPQLAQ